MADHGELEYAAADGNDYAAHEQTYVGFVKMVKVGIAVASPNVVVSQSTRVGNRPSRSKPTGVGFRHCQLPWIRNYAKSRCRSSSGDAG